MKRERGESSGGGIGVLGLLGVAFVVLKLAEIGPVAHWSWWWVTVPFWGGLALLAAIGVVAFLVYGAHAVFEAIRYKRR